MLRYYLEDSKHAYEEQRLKLKIFNSLVTSCRSSDAHIIPNDKKSQYLFVRTGVPFSADCVYLTLIQYIKV